MTISVIMAAFNGEKYIVEQLESIRTQSRQADEVLIFDDCSTDDTFSIVYRFIEEHSLSGTWKLVQNIVNVGWKKNFMNAFSAAKGDIIFPTDQDDIWLPQKIAAMVSVLENRQEINVLVCNVDLFYEKSANKNKHSIMRLTKRYRDAILSLVAFDHMWLEPLRPGCTMCFRREILPMIEVVWFPQCAHDLAIWSIGIVTDSVYILNQTLIRYRRHMKTNTPSNKKDMKTRCNMQIIYKELTENIIKNAGLLSIHSNKLAFLNEMKNFYFKRYLAIKRKNIFYLLALIRYWGKYPSKKAWLADVIASYR